MSRDMPVPERALAIAAHPDDVEFGCGGTFAKWAEAGCVVHHLVCTDGSKGSWEASEDPATLVATRQDEQRAAAKALGSTGVIEFLGAVDGELDASLRLRAQVCRVIREVRPDVVLGHDPWRRYRPHPDHRNAGFLAVEGVVAARDPHFFPDQDLAHWRPSALLLWEADEVDHVEDVSGHTDAKLAALFCHESQLRSTMDIDAGAGDEAAQRDRFRRRVLDRLATFGRVAGVAYGEGFKLIANL